MGQSFSSISAFRSIWLALAVAGIMLAAPIAEASSDRIIAVFPGLAKRNQKNMMKRVEAALQAEGESLEGIRLLMGWTKSAKRRKLATKALKKCGRNLSCMAKLGRVRGASEVMLLRAEGNNQDGRVAILVVGSKNAKVARGLRLDIAGLQDTEAALQEQSAAIFDVDLPQEDDPMRHAPSEPVIERVASSHQLETISATPTRIASAMVATAYDITDTRGVESQYLPDAASQPISGVEAAVHPNGWWEKQSWLSVGGTSLAGVGLGLLTTGAVFGFMARSTHGSISTDGSISQPEAVRLNDEANSQTRMANAFLLVGAIVTAVGGGMLGTDYLLQDDAP